MIEVLAQDEKGKTWLKPVKILRRDNRNVISFGWPVEYNLVDVGEVYPLNNEHGFCIDAGGLNHNGSPVYIPCNEINRALEYAAYRVALQVFDKE